MIVDALITSPRDQRHKNKEADAENEQADRANDVADDAKAVFHIAHQSAELS